MFTLLRRVVVVLGFLAASGRAYAQAVTVIEPANGQVLDLGSVNIGATSQPARIALMNTSGGQLSLLEVGVQNPTFSIVASGGDLEPGHTAYWDIVASPPDLTQPDVCFGEFSLTFRSPNDTDLVLPVLLSCIARNVPLHAEPLDFGEIAPTTIATLRFPVVNTTATPLAIAEITSSDPTFEVRLVGGSWPLTLAPEGVIELDLRYAPTAPSQGRETSIVATLGDGTSHVITQAFGSSGAEIVFRVGSIAENTPVGAAWRRYGVLANYATQPIVVTGIDITRPEVALLGIAVGDAVPPHTEIPLLTQVAPAADGAISAEITLRFAAAPAVTDFVVAFGKTTALELTTEDAVPGDGQLDFGTLSPSSPPVTRKITITNHGEAGAFLQCIDYAPGQGFTAEGCDTVLAAGASLEISVTFTPGSPRPVPLVDRRTGGFRLIQSHDTSYIVALTAVIPTYTVERSADRLAFADTVRSPATPALLDVTITNLGVTAMPVPAATVTGAGFALGSTPPSGVIAPLASVVYRVAFAPPAIGAFDGVLALAGAGEVALHGTGTLRPVSSDAALELGVVEVGSRVRRSIAVHNAGATPIAIGALRVEGARFAVIAPADPMIAAGGDVAIEVEYAPVDAAMDVGRLAIALDGDAEPQLFVALRGTGVAKPGEPAPQPQPSPSPEPGSDPETGCSIAGGPGSAIVALGVLGLLARRPRRRRV